MLTAGHGVAGVFPMKAADVKDLSSMPLSSPSYPRGPYRFIDREYLIVTYESDPEAIRGALDKHHPDMRRARLHPETPAPPDPEAMVPSARDQP